MWERGSLHTERLIRRSAKEGIEINLSKANLDPADDSLRLSFMVAGSKPMQVDKRYGPLVIEYKDADTVRHIKLEPGREGKPNEWASVVLRKEDLFRLFNSPKSRRIGYLQPRENFKKYQPVVNADYLKLFLK